MTLVLPLFPLNLVLFPTDTLNLNIFEPRYLQLVEDCLKNKTNFGIPAFIDTSIRELGAEVRITEISKRYDDGRLDIKTKVMSVFRLLSFKNPVSQEKLYAGGEIERIVFEDDASFSQKENFLAAVSALYRILQLDHDFSEKETLLSFHLGHKLGLSVLEEYELVGLKRESERLAFLMRHLERITPIVSEVERSKERIRLNGHFQNFNPLDFKNDFEKR
ncbi:LON peptidase substrate-binding domain-containing protein [Hugenholtzia roseola]|uniref:LON peptidase substrate-binding domain-containing protein n=1 Tax=Hugenholtzia roseola TaxID=1002 RepID=UPI0003F69BCB|nr:LON peptidase substrate-binding domain-containing protein [Hugenholtzia roseola]